MSCPPISVVIIIEVQIVSPWPVGAPPSLLQSPLDMTLKIFGNFLV